MADEITVEKLKVELEADINQLKKDLNSAKSQFTGFEKDIDTSSKSMSSSLGGLGKAAAAAFAIKEVSQFAMECIDLASDLQEVQNVVDVTFGDMADQVNDFAKNAMESFGLSETAAKQYAGTMGAMLQSSGLSQDMALEMSTTLTSLSADLASFYNLSNEEAFAKVRSGMSGETEPLKALGINLSVANMEAYALSQGITKSYDAMTQAEQAVLRYNYLIATTAAQQGDFARTSDSWANQTKVLSMRFDELKSSIGTGLIVVLNPVLELVNSLVSGLSSVVNVIGDLIGLGGNEQGESIDTSSYVNQLEQPVQVVSKDLGTASKNANGVADGIKKATTNANKLKATLSGFDEANVLSSQDTSGIGSNGALGGLIKDTKDFAEALNDAYADIEKLTDESKTMNSLWGTVSLSTDQVRRTAQYIINDKNFEKLTEMSAKLAESEKLATSIEEVKQKIDAYNWMIEMGITLTQSEMDEYRNLVIQFINDTNDYFNTRTEGMSLALGITFGEDSDIVSQFNDLVKNNKKELNKISEDIEKELNKSFEDGVFTVYEAEEVARLMKQKQDIINKIASAESKAQWTTIEVDFGNLKLSEDTYDNMVTEIQKQLDSDLSNRKEALTASLEGIEFMFLENPKLSYNGVSGQDAYELMKKEALESYKNDTAEIELNAMNVLINSVGTVIGTNVDDDLKEAAKTINEKWTQALENLEGEQGDFTTIWESLMSSTMGGLTEAFDNVSPEVKEIVNKLLEDLEPREQALKELRDKYLKEGKKVPENVSKGLSDIYLLKAMRGDVDGLMFLIGNQFKDNPQMLAVLKEAKKRGVDIPESMIDGVNAGKIDLENGIDDALYGVGIDIKNNKEPEKAGEQKGKSTTNSISTGINNQSMLQKVGTSIAGVVSWIQKGASKIELSDEGKKALSTLIIGLTNNPLLQKVSTSADTLEKKVVAGCKPSLLSNGKSSTQSFATGLLNSTMIGRVGYSAFQLVSKAANTAVSELKIKNGKSGKFDGYGKNTVEGYNDGISKNSWKTTSKSGPITNWLSNIATTFSKGLNINSPSRLFRGYGLSTVEGYDLGIEKNVNKSKRTMQAWGNDIARWGSDYVQQDLNVGVGTRFSGNITSDITGNLESALIGAMSSQQNTFFAEINIGGEKHVVQFVKKYNQMHASNPNLAFNL